MAASGICMWGGRHCRVWAMRQGMGTMPKQGAVAPGMKPRGWRVLGRVAGARSALWGARGERWVILHLDPSPQPRLCMPAEGSAWGSWLSSTMDIGRDASGGPPRGSARARGRMGQSATGAAWAIQGTGLGGMELGYMGWGRTSHHLHRLFEALVHCAMASHLEE